MYEPQDKAYRPDSTLAGAGQAENPLMSLMRDYVRAKESFDHACHSFQKCSEQRAAAEKELLGLSEKVAAVVQQGVYDPTAPQPAMPLDAASNSNGRYQGGLSPARY